jgi:hypothetical protein
MVRKRQDAKAKAFAARKAKNLKKQAETKANKKSKKTNHKQA